VCYPHRRRIFHRIVSPSYYRSIYYDYGPYYRWGYVWPYHHRRYVFVSLGGWWPYYTYRRYYWYPSHYYAWYGRYPDEYVVERGDTHNYYTYNYYYDSEKPRLEEKPEEKPPEPDEETQADRCFDEGVKAFENGNYARAVERFQDALELASDDIVLPFAYAQALFAKGRYEKAAEALREALSKAPPQKEGAFYPRGLYLDADILNEQIDKLSRAVRLTLDADLQLLLGYQLLGMGRFDEAIEPLQNAQQDEGNHQAATLLMTLLDKLRNTEEKQSGSAMINEKS
jgi:tetratricopeptide (TPR) repeat protein